MRIGYLGKQNLLKLQKIIHGLEDIKLTEDIPKVCEGCMYERQSRLSFRRSNTEWNLMELVHSDLLGPIRVLSLAGSRYVLTFIEEKSHFPKCYYLKTKKGNTILEKFKEYKAWAENITGKKIKVLRTDGGTEYVNKIMRQYLEGQGIEHQKTIPYTP